MPPVVALTTMPLGRGGLGRVASAPARGAGGGVVAGLVADVVDRLDDVERSPARPARSRREVREVEQLVVELRERPSGGGRAVDVVPGEVRLGVVVPVECDARAGAGRCQPRRVAGRAFRLDVGDQVDVVVEVVVGARRAEVVHRHQVRVRDDLPVLIARGEEADVMSTRRGVFAVLAGRSTPCRRS